MSAPYDLSDSTLVIAERWFEILEEQKEYFGIQDIWFGDQTNTPRTPAICVEPGAKRRQLAGVPDMTQIMIDTDFLLYHGVIDESQKAKRDSIMWAERVEQYLHQNHIRLFSADATQQLTIHGFCTDFDPGYAYKQGTTFHSVKMTWTSLTKTSLQRVF